MQLRSHLLTLFKKEKAPDFSLKDLNKQQQLEGKLPEGFEEVEKYWLEKPFSAALIAVHESKGYYYCVLEPLLSDEEQALLNQLRKEILEIVPKYVSDDDRTTLFNAFKHVVREKLIPLETASKLWYYIERDALKAGKITPLLYDPYIEDISCSGYGKPVYVYHSKYESMPTSIVMQEEELDDFVLSVAQRRGIELSIANPIVDTTLYDGSRIQITFRSEVTDHGSTFTVRKIRKEPITPVSLISWNTFSAEEMALIWLSLESNSSILFAGGTAGGKTTAMNAAALFIPPNAKIISIEDTREILLPHKNWIPSVAKKDMFSLLKTALRHRPDYIIVGEVRGKEVIVMFQAMSLGHTALSTIHGGSAKAVIDRITSPPLSVPEPMLHHLDLIVFVGRYQRDKKIIRRCAGIWELDEKIELNPVFEWDPDKDIHVKRNPKAILEKIAWRRGWSKKDVEKEIERRTELLQYLTENGIASLKPFSDIISRYYHSPDAVLSNLVRI